MGYQLTWRLIAAGHEVTLLNRGTHPDPFGGRVSRLRADRTQTEFFTALAGRDFDAAVDFAAFQRADAEGVVKALEGRVGHYVLISTGQVYLVRDGRAGPRARGGLRRPADGGAAARPSRPQRLGVRDGEARLRGRARGGVERAAVPVDPPAHPDRERRA